MTFCVNGVRGEKTRADQMSSCGGERKEKNLTRIFFSPRLQRIPSKVPLHTDRNHSIRTQLSANEQSRRMIIDTRVSAFRAKTIFIYNSEVVLTRELYCKKSIKQNY